MCGRVLSKGLILWDLGLNRITLTAMLRTEHGTPGETGRHGGLAQVVEVEMAKCPLCAFLKWLIFLCQVHTLPKVSFPSQYPITVRNLNFPCMSYWWQYHICVQGGYLNVEREVN